MKHFYKFLIISTFFWAHLSAVKIGSDSEDSLTNDCKHSLHEMVIADDVVTLEQYLNDGGNIETLEPYSGETALHKAAWYGSTRCARLLLENGAQIRYKYFSKYDEHELYGYEFVPRALYTPVYYAVLQRRTPIIRLFCALCYDDKLFDAKNSETGLKPSELALEKWGMTLDELAEEGKEGLKKALAKKKRVTDESLDRKLHIARSMRRSRLSLKN